MQRLYLETDADEPVVPDVPADADVPVVSPSPASIWAAIEPSAVCSWASVCTSVGVAIVWGRLSWE